jgi:hypothetical protein
METIYFKVTHPAYGEDTLFDDWTLLCKVTMALAEAQTKERLDTIFNDLMCKMSDEMIATAEEYVPTKKELKLLGIIE